MDKKDYERGSVTLEASIVVPLFIMLMLFVNGFFVLFMGQQVMTHTLLQSAKSMAYDPYATQRYDGSGLATLFNDAFALISGSPISTDKWFEDGSDDVDDIAKARFLMFLADSEDVAKKKLETIGVQNGLDGLDFSESKVDSGILTIKVKYKQEFMFNMFDFATMDRELEVKVNLFEYKQ